MARNAQTFPEPTSPEEVLERLKKAGFEVEVRKADHVPDLVEVPGLGAVEDPDEVEERS